MENLSGTVFNIQKFCIHDGPGIRSTVFLKGCPLRCKWCHNPESNLSRPQLMFHNSLCTGCGVCVKYCPAGAISLLPNTGKSHTNPSICTACGKCASEEVCEHTARSLSGHSATVSEVVKEVMKDKIFYRSSGGGVTVSGGEPLMQPEFTRSILQGCKKMGISTAIETSGFADWETASRVFEYADLLLYDIKHMDTVRHKALTGVGNERIHDNLRRAVTKMNKKIWLRLPLIKGVNDSEKEILEIRDLALELGNKVEEIWLLAYHNLGLSKLEALGASTKVMKTFETPKAEYLQYIKSILEEKNLTIKLG